MSKYLGTVVSDEYFFKVKQALAAKQSREKRRLTMKECLVIATSMYLGIDGSDELKGQSQGEVSTSED